jgi:hypothetical protein
MTMSTIPMKALRPTTTHADGDTTTPAWDLYLDGELVASGYVSEVAARMELDLAAWYALFGEAPLVADIAITDEALDLALAVFNRLFTTQKIQEKGRMALEKIIRPEIYTIAADGSLHVLASSSRGKQSSYTITAHRSFPDDTVDSLIGSYHVTMTCGCKDFYARAHEHGGVCKHVAARLLLYLAQRGVAALNHLQDALDSEDTLPLSISSTLAPADQPLATDEADMAFVTITAADLAAALFLTLHAATPIELRAERGRLHLVGDATDLKLRCLDGSGTAAVSLEADVISTLYDQLRPAARSAGAISLFVETTSGSVYLCSQDETFSAEARGVPITALTTPLTA